MLRDIQELLIVVNGTSVLLFALLSEYKVMQHEQEASLVSLPS